MIDSESRDMTEPEDRLSRIQKLTVGMVEVAMEEISDVKAYKRMTSYIDGC